MGNQASLTREDIHSIGNFDEKAVAQLFARFQALDSDGSGRLDRSEILGIADLDGNPLVERVISVFDTDGTGPVSFLEFLLGLAKLTAGTEDERKFEFAFAMYDVNKDGYISNGDLFKVLSMMVGESLGEEQLQQLVDRQIICADKDGDGKLSFEEFKAAVQNISVAEQLSIDLKAY
mmetsp:Transcript_57067/g.157905  ORF Transcript_57067/g.157905 Transcript_57067/m.157905 type:complete len:177 (+) Transcript_57067:93-623(+)|eukprot:CAMPEP_0176232832 /NCGR_PEP_ID=MMETSP0121_2-20121125/25511_1 /TAXON_ID=160619 /ORGANISM="Kryptoperidinium foliaceum, Strain CCMP 1326" /LENGTH=176 /DNA_ID=CAMNT_0017572205 /DNA_START=81 /DNA_END=611 /DNA_ORIENTATION=+